MLHKYFYIKDNTIHDYEIINNTNSRWEFIHHFPLINMNYKRNKRQKQVDERIINPKLS